MSGDQTLLALEADKFTAICEAIFYKCGIVNNSHPYRQLAACFIDWLHEGQIVSKIL
jgi:hypothetical protein